MTTPQQAGQRQGREPAAPRRSIEEVFGVATLAALVLITLANVLVRYLTDRSFAWTEEISVFLLVVMTLAGSAAAALHDGHLRVEFFYARGSAQRRRFLVLLSALATAAMFVLLGVLLVRSGLEEYQFGDTTMGLGLPRWWYTAWLPALALLVALRAAIGGWARSREIEGQEGGTEP